VLKKFGDAAGSCERAVGAHDLGCDFRDTLSIPSVVSNGDSGQKELFSQDS
jgi:hypothetical protein